MKSIIRSDCNKHIPKRAHYTRKDNKWKPKKPFESEEEANAWISKHKMKRYVSYRCPVCGKWHIGYQKA